MDSFHLYLDELERLLSDDEWMNGRLRPQVLCYAAFVGFNPVVEAIIQKGVGEEYKHPIISFNEIIGKIRLFPDIRITKYAMSAMQFTYSL